MGVEGLMLPENGRFRSTTGRAGNTDIVSSYGMILGSWLHQKTRLVKFILWKHNQVDRLRIDNILPREMVVGMAGVATSMVWIEVLYQKMMEVNQRCSVIDCDWLAILVPLDNGGGHTAGWSTQEDDIVGHITRNALLGVHHGGELIYVGNVEDGGQGHQKHVVHSCHTLIPALLSMML